MLNKEELKVFQQELTNTTEEIVLDQLNQILDREEFKDICKCKSCLLDMATYALNRLPARYVATSRGEVFSKTDELEQQHSVDLLSVVLKSVKIVAADCKHK
ncbi:late competence development ComFB family protein [Halanaerobium salsuginis]|jgi:competence protein ComFB|uniref:Competence protein ComFB n=1 Tax=Halanaerobium salsuginis TaxID=29563 RepID=A0A1I4I979_9FIRM|nr:late competence development ComFB family protein [Halanaerobium salsuginis]SFL50603.1 competence protein ComFB [Halanaerobium salsuginis]